MNHGLHFELHSLSAALVDAGQRSADETLSPHDQHSAREQSGRLPAKIEAVTQAILENQELDRELSGMLAQLEASKHKSRHRSIVITHLENAQDRIRRELGDPVLAQ